METRVAAEAAVTVATGRVLDRRLAGPAKKLKRKLKPKTDL